MLRHILLQTVERNFTILECCTDNLMFFVPNAKYNPSKLMVTYVCFIAKSGEVFAQLIDIKVGLCFLKFDNLIL